MSRVFVTNWPFGKAVKNWPVKSNAVRRELAKHWICPDCGSDCPTNQVARCIEPGCGWRAEVGGNRDGRSVRS